MNLKDGGKYLSTDIVVLVFTIGISVAGTFFATKASLEARIEKLETTLPVATYITTHAVTHNINELSFLRTEIIDLTEQVNNISIPKLQFDKGVPKEYSTLPITGWTPWALTTEWVANLDDPGTEVKPLEIERLSKLLDGDAASSLRADDAFLRLQNFMQLATEFNRGLGSLNYPFGAPASQLLIAYPTLRRGASRAMAEAFVNRERDLVPAMKQSLKGLRPMMDDEVQGARAILETLNGKPH